MDWSRQQMSDGMARDMGYQQFLRENRAYDEFLKRRRTADAATLQWIQNIYKSVPDGENRRITPNGDGTFVMHVPDHWVNDGEWDDEYGRHWSARHMVFREVGVGAPSQTSGLSQYDIPVWGAATHAADAWQQGRYLDALVWEVNGFGEMFGVEALYKLAATKLTRLYLSRQATKESSNILLNSSRQLQAKFKHAVDFGVNGNYSKANASKFSAAINQHINASGTQMIQGAYRNASNPVTSYLNPQTGLNIIASPSGQFISGATLSPAQVQSILTRGFLW